MSRQFASARFLVLTLAALLVLAGTFSLGQWQLRRAAQKQALLAAVEGQAKLATLDVSDLASLKNEASALHRPARLSGVWRGQNTIFLDNRPMGGKSGFVVVTPLALTGSHQVILVQRGWVPRNFVDRSDVPVVATPAGPVLVQGRIAPPPSKLYEFKATQTGLIRQNLDMAAFRLETGLPLAEVTLLETGAASDGLLRNWAAPDLGLEKHYGYAFQWFSLCALVFFLYLWFQLWVPMRARRAKKSELS